MAALELNIRPGDAARLLRMPAFSRRTGRAVAIDRVWHDTADGSLEADGLHLHLQKGHWRLERARPAAGAAWPLGTPVEPVAEAASLETIGHDLPGPLMPLAGFRGRQRTIPLEDSTISAEVTLLEGVLRGVTQESPVCRLTLMGPAPFLLSLSSAIGAAVPLTAPRWSLASEAIGLARGTGLAGRPSCAPTIAPGSTLADAVALVLGQLTRAILFGVLNAAEGRTPQPVHQLRVAVRRLRSALSIFSRAVDATAFETVKTGLKQLATVLGAARDWDVFLEGTGRAVADALPGDERITAMLEAGERRRVAAYAALGSYLAGDAFNALELALVQLTTLRPWAIAATDEQHVQLGEPADGFGTRMLGRRLDQMLRPGPDISELPVEDLHTIRKAGKRLRYASEFFAPLYGKRSTRRFIGRLTVLQEALGHLNDTAAAGALMTSLGRAADRQFAAGAVQGFVAAHHGNTRGDISDAWAKFRRQEPFWT